MCVVAAPSREPSFLLSNEELDFSFSAKEKKAMPLVFSTPKPLVTTLSFKEKTYSADTKPLLSHVQQGLYSLAFKP